MFKELGKIFLNQLKVKGFQVILEALTSTMLEYNRKASSGDFDLRNQNQNNVPSQSAQPQQKSGGLFNMFKNIN